MVYLLCVIDEFRTQESDQLVYRTQFSLESSCNFGIADYAHSRMLVSVGGVLLLLISPLPKVTNEGHLEFASKRVGVRCHDQNGQRFIWRNEEPSGNLSSSLHGAIET